MTLMCPLATFRSLARSCAALWRLATVVLVVGCGGSTPPLVSLVSVAITPANPSIAKGTNQLFKATGTYSDQSTNDLSVTATWTSGTVATATISSAGLATAVAAGTTVIRAVSAGITGSTTLIVTTPPTPPRKLVSIAISPATPSIAKGSTQKFTATGTFDDNTTADLTDTVTWSSGTQAIATVSATGLATTVAYGPTIITASSEGVSGTAVLTVQPVI